MVSEEVQALANVGLTLSQAKVYLALFKLEDPRARALSKIVDIARQDVYRILSELEQLGLVERIVASPTRFKPTPIKNALLILLQRKYIENSELQEKAIKIFSSSKNWNKDTIAQLDETEFEVRNVYSNDPRVKTAAMSAEDMIRLLDRKPDWPILFSFLEDLTYALKRGVRVNIITETTSTQDRIPKFMDTLMKEPLFQIKCLPTLPSAKILIFDTREVAIWEMTNSNATGKPRPTRALWSNHHGLVELASNYFKVTWNTASDLMRAKDNA